MYRADKLYNDMMAVDTAIKQLKVEDEASLAEYFRLYTELIFNHKWIGSIYDIYSDNADIYRENGLYLHGAHEMMKDTLKLTSAFPDMQVTMRDTFAVKRDDGYKLWRYYTMSGTNKTYSIYGAATNKPLNSDACIAMSMATVKKISGRWQIVKEFTMYSIDEIREQLINDVMIKPYSSPYKIYIIDEAQKLTLQAQNALLKTIEEPPAYAVVMLLADNPDALLPTISSYISALDAVSVS